MKCPLCNCVHLNTIHSIDNIPAFQNKAYDTEESALSAPVGNISLDECQGCGFVFNSKFNNEIMKYDTLYQNEQGYSKSFNSHIKDIVDILINNGFNDKRIVEIGCGQGYFLEKLQYLGFDIVGFDPAYDGLNPKIIKDYFTGENQKLDADLIILRHVIEHIPSPFNLLKSISEANNYKGMIFIETPDFDWIVNNKVFFDIFHEHCNYFNQKSISNMFEESYIKTLFNGQYMCVLANLEDLRGIANQGEFTPYSKNIFKKCLENYRKFIREHEGLLVYGAGAKGVTLANLTDPNRQYIQCLVDINPKKQNKYIARTAHKIISQEELKNFNNCDIIVVNDNYLEEIRKNLSGMSFSIYGMGEINGSN